VSGLSKEFSGLKKAPFLAIQVNLIAVSYEGKNYNIECKMVTETKGDGLSTVGDDTIVTGIVSVYTLEQAEPEQSAQ
jgi:hypothetical protein